MADERGLGVKKPTDSAGAMAQCVSSYSTGGRLDIERDTGGRGRLVVIGRQSRAAAAAKATGLYLPGDLRRRIEAIHRGGGINGALVALIQLGLDVIERDRLTATYWQAAGSGEK